jgi:hypothetical protein
MSLGPVEILVLLTPLAALAIGIYVVMRRRAR